MNEGLWYRAWVSCSELPRDSGEVLEEVVDVHRLVHLEVLSPSPLDQTDPVREELGQEPDVALTLRCNCIPRN